MIHLDFETYSSCDIKRAGAKRYAVDSSTGIICMAYAFDRGEPRIWTPWMDDPEELLARIRDGELVYAHNSQFEEAIWDSQVPYYLPVGADRRPNWRCTQAIAQANALPGSLDGVASFLGLEVQKDKEGRKVMLRAAKAKNLEAISPEDLQVVCEYCKQDVRVERAIHDKLGDLDENETKVWLLDRKINSRGLSVDLDLVRKVIEEVEAAQSSLVPRLLDLTNNAVTKPTQTKRIIDWARDQEDFEIPNLRADTVVSLISDPNTPEKVREVLEIRQLGSKSSTAKYQRILDMEVGGRIYNSLRYHAASTGRWGGAGVQPQNLPRPETDKTDELADLFMADADYSGLVDGVFNAAKSLVRSAIIPGPHRELVACDLSAIEARVLPWLAGENWKLEAFREFDRGAGPDIYITSYAAAFGANASEVTKDQRMIGKVQELSLGYQGGVGAYVSMARIYGVEIGDYVETIEAANPELFAKVELDYPNRGGGYDRNTWLAAETIKRAWRLAHPATCKFWWKLNNDALEAVQHGRAGDFVLRDDRLLYRLPSGRMLTYWKPYIKAGEYGPEMMYWRPSQGRMVREKTYGGKLTENVVQATARDILASSMLRLDSDGVDLRLTVHDEIVAECPEGAGEFYLKLAERVMSTPKAWFSNCPLAAEGFYGKRYRK